MKKILALFALISCITATYNSFTAENFAQDTPAQQEQKEEKNNKYDFQRDLRKFKEKNKDRDYTDHPLYKKEPLDSNSNLPWEVYERSITVADWPQYREKLIEILEKEGAEAINKPTIEGYGGSPLYWAVRAADFPFVKFCLQHGGMLNEGPKGMPHFPKDPYHLIGNAETTEMIKYLEENGEDIMPFNKDPRSGKYFKKTKDQIIKELVDKAKTTNK